MSALIIAFVFSQFSQATCARQAEYIEQAKRLEVVLNSLELQNMLDEMDNGQGTTRINNIDLGASGIELTISNGCKITANLTYQSFGPIPGSCPKINGVILAKECAN